jgi:hypothetical protein
MHASTGVELAHGLLHTHHQGARYPLQLTWCPAEPTLQHCHSPAFHSRDECQLLKACHDGRHLGAAATAARKSSSTFTSAVAKKLTTPT